MKNKEEYNVVNTHTEHVGRFNIICDEVEKEGSTYPYSYVVIKNCAAVLCFYKGKILLLHQYRHALKTWELEIPAGSIEPGDDPMMRAKEEVKEETGLNPGALHYLGTYHLSSGSTTERVWLYWTELEEGAIHQNLEALEVIDLKAVTPEEFETLIATNEFHQCMGVTAWYLYKGKTNPTSDASQYSTERDV